MIWHHAPSQELISLPVKMQKRAFDDLRDVVSSKPTRAVSRVLVLFKSTTQFARSWISLIKTIVPGQFRLPTLDDLAGYCVVKSKGHALRERCDVGMGEVASIMDILVWSRGHAKCRASRVPDAG